MRRILFLAFVLFEGCATAPRPSTGDTKMPLTTIQQLRQQYQSGQQVVVGVIGNSHACGYRADGTYQGGADMIAPTLLTGTLGGRATAATQNLTSVGGWAQQLQVYLKAKNSTSLVQNLSGSGWTTKNHIDRGTVAAMAALTPKPTHVFIPLQVNDRGKDDINFPGSVEKIPWATFISNTYAIVQAVIDAGMTPILVKEINTPFRAGTGWWWIENEYTGTGAPAGNHHGWSEYMAQVDVIANDARWAGTALGGAVEVIDTYTPSLNTGQEATYVYDYGRPGGTTNPSIDLSAPADWRYSLSKGWITPTEFPAIGSPYFDGLHPSQAGHNVILDTYKSWFQEVEAPLLFTAQPSVASSTDDGAIIAYGTADPAADDVTASATTSATVNATATLRDASSALITAGVSAADVNRMVESLTVTAGVSTVITDTLQSVEAALAEIGAFPTVADLLTLASGITAPFAWSAQPVLVSSTADGGVVSYSTYDTGFDDVTSTADVSVQVAELLAKVDNLLTTVEAVPSVADLLAQVENITATAQAVTEAADVKLAGVAESLVSAADAIAEVVDLQLMVDNVTTMAMSGADIQELIEFIDMAAVSATVGAYVIDTATGDMISLARLMVTMRDPLALCVKMRDPLNLRVTMR